jgi:hypothetical protein
MSGGKRGRKGTKKGRKGTRKVRGKKMYMGGGMNNNGMNNGMNNSNSEEYEEEEPVMMGGKRKASPWNKLVKKVFNEMRRKDKNATFSDALKAASKRKSEM